MYWNAIYTDIIRSDWVHLFKYSQICDQKRFQIDLRAALETALLLRQVSMINAKLLMKGYLGQEAADNFEQSFIHNYGYQSEN